MKDRATLKEVLARLIDIRRKKDTERTKLVVAVVQKNMEANHKMSDGKALYPLPVDMHLDYSRLTGQIDLLDYLISLYRKMVEGE